MKTRVFFLRPEVPGRCPSNGVVGTVRTFPSRIGVTARPSPHCEWSLLCGQFMPFLAGRQREGKSKKAKVKEGSPLLAFTFAFLLLPSQAVTAQRPSTAARRRPAVAPALRSS